jgi:flavin reductase (DIM6/NTAB) family NADH-FMN oxidoreductase RutF
MTAALDPKEFRRAYGQFLTGVTIVTTRDEDGTPVGITANSFTSASLEPPMVLICLDQKLASYRAFQVGRPYAVHVLSEDQADLSSLFAKRGADKFGALECGEGLDGVPVLPDYLALFECRIVHCYPAGDHTIFVGQVENLAVSTRPRRPLGFFSGEYAAIERQPPAPPPPEDHWALGWS